MHPVGDLFGARDLEALAFLDGGDEVAGVQQRVAGSRVEPGETAGKQLDLQFAGFQVGPVDVRDLQLAPRGWLEVRGDLEDVIVVEVQAGDRVRWISAAAASLRSRPLGLL